MVTEGIEMVEVVNFLLHVHSHSYQLMFIDDRQYIIVGFIYKYAIEKSYNILHLYERLLFRVLHTL